MVCSMRGLVINLTGIFSFFRIPYNSLLMDTYLFPPKTTVVGIVGAALGWNEKTFLENIKNFKYGLILESIGEVLKETAVIYKNEDSPIYPITKNMVYKPVYKIFLTSSNDSLIESAYKALQDPKYVLTLGDSENLVYPKTTHFVKIMDIVEKPTDKLKCILPSKIYNAYKHTLSIIKNDILSPREIKIPVDFTGSGKKRRFIAENVFYYSGIELHFERPIQGVYDIDGDAVYLF